MNHFLYSFHFMASQIHSESFDDIIFNKRNKAYGAYCLRKIYNFNLILGIIISISAGFLFSIIYLYTEYTDQTKINSNLNVRYEASLIKDMNGLYDKPPQKSTVSISKNKPANLIKAENFIPVVVDSIIDQAKPDIMSFTGDTSGLNSDSFPKQKIVLKIENENELRKIYFEVEKMPMFPDGEAGLRRYIALNVKYPPLAREKGIEGTIYLRFCVTSEGKVENVSVIKGIDPILDKEAIRVIRNLPQWLPGEQQGIKVNVWYIVPINFKL